jgi:ParB family chromosome partitioning protein
MLLQLSREESPTARAEVCQALAALDDPRAVDRLRSLLFDSAANVRDAAFTALLRLQSREPLRAAEAGLNAPFEDVRRRGLEAVAGMLRQQPELAEKAGPALDLLGQALNDSDAGVRKEAFKTGLNLQVAGGGVRTLRFLLHSIHADVRREVLTETMAQVGEPWAWALLLEFYNDPDPRLREEAFTFAVRKNKELPPLEAALLSQFPDIRCQAVDALIKKHSAPAQALLVRALDDGEKTVRQRALEALVGEDAQGPLTAALASPHADVRVRAARALARHGSAAALGPLVALASAPEPQEQERRPDWLALAESALEGLAELGDAAALPSLTPLLRSEHATLRQKAAEALAWVALPNLLETLRLAMQHDDPQVKYHAALGLAYAGDPLVASLVFSDAAAAVLTPGERLVAAFTLGQAGEDRLAAFLDDADEGRRTWAVLLLMLLELAARQEAPVRCLAVLSARPPRVRLVAARALERFANPAAFATSSCSSSTTAATARRGRSPPMWSMTWPTFSFMVRRPSAPGRPICWYTCAATRPPPGNRPGSSTPAASARNCKRCGELPGQRRRCGTLRHSSRTSPSGPTSASCASRAAPRGKAVAARLRWSACARRHFLGSRN